MTYKQLQKKARDCGKDAVADGMDLQDCAYDLADCMLYDPDVMKRMLIEFPGIRRRNEMKEILADMICG